MTFTIPQFWLGVLAAYLSLFVVLIIMSIRHYKRKQLEKETIKAMLSKDTKIKENMEEDFSKLFSALMSVPENKDEDKNKDKRK